MGVSKYTPELADEICERISSGETLRSICRDSHMPSWVTIYNWVDSDSKLALRFARARTMGFDAIAEELIDLVEAPLKSNDLAVKPADIVAHRRLEGDIKLKLLAKWSPSKYGDRAADTAEKQKVEVIINTMQGTAQVANADTATE